MTCAETCRIEHNIQSKRSVLKDVKSRKTRGRLQKCVSLSHSLSHLGSREIVLNLLHTPQVGSLVRALEGTRDRGSSLWEPQLLPV